MNNTTPARCFVLLLLTTTVALATASAAPDQAAIVQIEPTSIHHTIHSGPNDTASIQATPQQIAFLAGPAATKPQVDNWNKSQAVSPEPQTPGIKDSTLGEPAMIICPVIVLRSQPTVMQRIGHNIGAIIP